MAAEGIPVELSCRVVDVSTSGYGEWLTRPASARSVRHAWLTGLITEIHLQSRATYGARRVHAELRLGPGIVVGHGAVELLMRRAGLAGAMGRPKWRRAKRDEVALDLVNRDFARSGPNQLWVTDITEHHTREGKLYCAVVLDTYSRRVVGWSIAPHRPARWSPTHSAWPSTTASPLPARSSTPTKACNSPRGPSPAAPATPGWCRRWAASATATTTA